MTTLLWGVPSEPPTAMVAAALSVRGAEPVTIDPCSAARAEIDLALSSDHGDLLLDGALRLGDRLIDLGAVTGMHLRPVEPAFVPGLASAERERAQRVHDTLLSFTELADALGGRRVANPLSAMASNMSKPYQAQLIARHGFYIPATLVSDDPDEVLDFAERHGRTIYKSTSGVRSVVTAFDPIRDRDRLARFRRCPVQFQELLDGPDVRVHTVGDRVLAVILDTTAVDYRYARAQVGSDARLRPHALDADLAERCVALAGDLGLPFAGIDLKLMPDGRVACFEVNPSPGFSWFEAETGVPVASAVADWLLTPA